MRRKVVILLETDERLAALLDTYEATSAQLQELQGRIAEFCIEEQVEQVDHNGIRLTFKPETIWNDEKLEPLREYFSPSEIESMLNAEVARKFNKTQMNKLAKQGGEIGRIINDAKHESLPQLKIKLPIRRGR